MKKKIALVTDSTCDFSQKQLNELSIYSLPLKIIYSDEEYKDRIDIQPEEVYQRFDTEIPSTSMPGLDEILGLFKRLKDEGYRNIIVIHISSGLSGTYNTSKMAAEQIDGVNIEVIDSKMLSLGLGRLVLYAGELISEGKSSFQDIVGKVRKKINNIELYFVVGTLKYLKEGGRIGKIKGTIGELLNIKPIIAINDAGKYYTYGKARSRKKSINKLFSIVKDKVVEGLCSIDVMHADAAEEAADLLGKLKSLTNVKKTYLGEISPAMVVHAGPGLLGVCINYLSK